MALTIKAIGEEANELLEDVGIHGSLVTEAVLEVCLTNDFTSWKYLFHKVGNSNVKTQLCAAYADLNGFLPDSDKELDQIICGKPHLLRLYSALFVKLFDAATFKQGDVITFAARKDALGKDIVNGYIDHKSQKVGTVSAWNQRITLTAKYRQKFIHAGHEELLMNDLTIYQEDFSEDETSVEKKPVLFKEIPAEHKIAIYEDTLTRKYEKLLQLDKARKDLNEEIEKDKEIRDKAKKKRQASELLEKVSSKLCKFQEIPNLESIKIMWDSYSKFFQMVKTKSLSISEPAELVLLQHKKEISSQVQGACPTKLAASEAAGTSMSSPAMKHDENTVLNSKQMEKATDTTKEIHAQSTGIRSDEQPENQTSTTCFVGSEPKPIPVHNQGYSANGCAQNDEGDQPKTKSPEAHREPNTDEDLQPMHHGSPSSLALRVGSGSNPDQSNVSKDCHEADAADLFEQSNPSVFFGPLMLEDEFKPDGADTLKDLKEVGATNPQGEESMENQEAGDESGDEVGAFDDNFEEGPDDSESNYSDNAFAHNSQYSKQC